MELISPWLLWLSIGATLFVMEMAVPGFILFFFGLAAWITAAGSYFFDWTVNIQLAVFLISSLVSLFGLRSLVQRVFIGDSKDDGEDTIMAKGGEKCTVTKAILPPAEGQVKFAGTFWRAESDEAIQQGEVVQISKQNDLLITVSKIEQTPTP
jgi:membrane protein implicated in regulation of membrane protease activity